MTITKLLLRYLIALANKALLKPTASKLLFQNYQELIKIYRHPFGRCEVCQRDGNFTFYCFKLVKHHRILNPKACKTTSLDSTVFDQWSAVSRVSCRNFYCVFLSLHLWQAQWTFEARASATTHFSYWCQLLLSLSSRRMSGKMFFFPWFPAWENHYTLYKTNEEKTNQEQTQKNTTKI